MGTSVDDVYLREKKMSFLDFLIAKNEGGNLVSCGIEYSR